VEEQELIEEIRQTDPAMARIKKQEIDGIVE